MRTSPITTCLWPGLTKLWFRGDPLALAGAVAFGFALNLILASSLIWPELLPTSVRLTGWIAIATIWSVCVVQAYRSLPHLCRSPKAADEGLFLQAQDEYLKGHWFEAESSLKKLLESSQDDVEANLMLATLYRHTRRLEEAAERLRLTERVDSAHKWHFEIGQERRILERLVNLKSDPDTTEESSREDDQEPLPT